MSATVVIVPDAPGDRNVALATPCPANDTVNKITYTYSAPNCVARYDYLGAMQTFTVPTGITSVTFQVVAASGGRHRWNGIENSASLGGNGGSVTGTLTVTPGSTLNLYVGGQGGSPTAGWNGGGTGGRCTLCTPATPISGGGGGASDIRIGGTALANRVVTAGGGGGAGGYGAQTSSDSANGGGNGGATAYNVAGVRGATGLAGDDSSWTTEAGGGATPIAGGLKGPYDVGQNHQDGSLGSGGNGRSNLYAGAGGGGHFGGGGANAGGGGGGSSYIDTRIVTSDTYSSTNVGHGFITLSYTAPFPSLTFATATSSPTNSSGPWTYTLTFSSNVDATSIAPGDFSNGGNAQNCQFAVSPTTGAASTFTVTVSNCGDGTITPTLASGSVIASSGVTGPGAAAPGTTITRDTTAPSSPTAPDLLAASDSGSSNSDNITTDNTPTFSVTGGSTGDVATITATNGGSSQSCTYTIGTGTSCDLPALTDGTWTVTGTLRDPAGNTSQASSPTTLTVDRVAPAAPAAPDLVSASDTGTSDSDNLTSDTTPGFSLAGTSPGDTVEFTATQGATTRTCSYVVGVSTSCDISPALGAGSWSVTAKVTDPAGNQSVVGAALPITVDTTAPSAPGIPDLAAASDLGTSSTDNLTSDTTPTVSATGGSTGDTMTISASNGSITQTCSYVIGSATSCDLPQLTDGTWSVTSRLSDAAGNQSSASSPLSLQIDATGPSGVLVPDLSASSDSGTSNTDNVTSDNTPTFSVPGGANGETATVSATNGTTTLTCSYVIGSATSCTLPALTDGTWSVTGSITDAAGNTTHGPSALSLRIDTVSPAPTRADLVVDSDTGASSTDNVTFDSTPEISIPGLSSGDAVTVTAARGSTSVSCTYVVGVANSCSLPMMSDGSWSISASVADAAGNIGATASSLTIDIDTTSPATPGVPDVLVGSDSGDSNTDNVTNVATPAVSIPGGTIGDTAMITASNGTTAVSCTYVVGTATSCDLPALSDGTWSLTGTLTDTAGNVSPASGGLSLTIDTAGPVFSGGIDLATSSDTGTSSTDNVTADSTPLIDVPGLEVGTKVTVSATNSATTVSCSFVVSSGVNGCTLPNLEDGTWTVIATATDIAGNSVTSLQPLAVRIDTVKPFSTPQTVDGAATNTQTISSAQPGPTVNKQPTVTLAPPRTVAPRGGVAPAQRSSTTSPSRTRGTPSSAPARSPAKPIQPSPLGTPDLRTESDSGVFRDDDVTNIANPVVGLDGLGTGDTVFLTARRGSKSLSCSYVVGTETGCQLAGLTEGQWSVTGRVVDLAGNDSDAPGILRLSIDPLAIDPVDESTTTTTSISSSTTTSVTATTIAVEAGQASSADEGTGSRDVPLSDDDAIQLLASALALLALRNRRDPDSPRRLQGDERESNSVAEFAAGSGSGGLTVRDDLYQPPRWPLLDRAMCTAAARWSAFSPALGRIIDDGSYLRALTGISWPILPLIGAALGFAAAADTAYTAVLPSLTIFVMLVIVGSLDATAGLAAAVMYGSAIVIGGGIDSADSLRGLLSMVAPMILISLVASVMRPFRRVTNEHSSWDRLVDSVLIPLMGAWAAGTMYAAIPHLSGFDVPWSDRKGAVELTVLLVLLVRYVLENVARVAVPRRLAEIENESLPEPVEAQKTISRVMRTALFVFVAVVFIGANGWLAAGTAMFLLPRLAESASEKLPNFPQFYRVIPQNLVRIVTLLLVALWWAGVVADFVDSNDIQWAFVLMSVPGLVLTGVDLVVRDGRQWETSPLSKILGVATLALGVVLVRGWWL